MPHRPGLSSVTLVLGLALAAAGCEVRAPTEDTYFDRSIAPILTGSCARSATGAACHTSDARGNAFGNLDVSTFAAIDKRRDLLASFGPYDQPGLLLKVVPPMETELRAHDGQRATITTDIRHTGGAGLDPASGAFRTLRRWIDNGATINNAGRSPAQYASLPCVPRPAVSSRDLSRDPSTRDFGRFRDEIAPLLHARCGAGNCHGSAQTELSLACGSGPEEVRADYFTAVDFLAAKAEESELLRRPLAPSAGGAYHGGGVIFGATGDADYAKLHGWATEHGPPDVTGLGPGFDFFAHRVQPMLVRKGCMQIQCHSPSIFHDYRLRGGASGSFSLVSTRKNYELSIAQLALETDDVRASRLVRKNLYRPILDRASVGITHRGGPLFEDLGGKPVTSATCDAGGYDYERGSLDAIPAVCVVREWLRRERAARPVAPLSAVVYVARDLPGGGGGLLDFDRYQPGSDLRRVDVTTQPDGRIAAAGDRSVLGGCGLSPATADVKRPAVSWDGAKVAFAARSSAGEPLRVYEMAADGSGCAPIAALGAHPPSDNGLLVHDFDPAYSPPLPGGGSAIVFASTRGNLDPAPYDYRGPQRTPADPSRPNANLYSFEPDPANPAARRVRQLTFLLNTERAPSFMADGRVVFTVEKRLPGFAQIGLRRINLDGGDYHPLFGQRGSVGYREVSQVVHLADLDFAAIFADRGVPDRGGAVGIFNRSIGPDLYSPDPKDYPLDASVLDPASLTAPDPRFFLHSLHLPDPAVSGRASASGVGLYTSPAPLPDGRVLVSHGLAGDYDVFVLDPASGAKERLAGAAGKADIEAVAVYGRAPRPVFRSTAGQANAYDIDERRPTAAVLVHDAPMILSLMMQNTPTGRVVDDGLRSFEVWEDLPPPTDVTSLAPGPFVARDEHGSVYVRRRLLGVVPIQADGSTRFEITGGLPLVYKLPETQLSRERNLPRVVSEHVMFTPGESLHEGLPRRAFDGFCAGCHGSASGKGLDNALQPDVLSRASDTTAYRSPPARVTPSPAERGPVVGP